jgi:hypothetical protein
MRAMTSSRLNLALIAPLLTLTLVAACGDRNTPAVPDAGADTGVQPDTTTAAAWTFSADDDGTTPGVALQADTIQGDSAWLKVVVRGVPTLQGVAFRLTHDPKQATVTTSGAGTVWGSAGVVSKFAARDDGELWAGVGHVGTKALDASKDTVVARVQLKLSGSGPIKVGFRPHHNLCLGTDGKSITATWLGGTFERK